MQATHKEIQRTTYEIQTNTNNHDAMKYKQIQIRTQANTNQYKETRINTMKCK